MKTLKDLFLAELANMYDAEHRIIKALPKLARAATCEKLKAAFLAHLEETKGHVTILEKVFGIDVRNKVGNMQLNRLFRDGNSMVDLEWRTSKAPM